VQRTYRIFRTDHGREELREEDFTSDDLEQLVMDAEGEVSFTDMRYPDGLTYAYLEPNEAADCLAAEFGKGQMELSYTYDRVDEEIEFTVRERVDPSGLEEDCWYREVLEEADEERPVRYILHGTVEADASEDDLLKLV
ncbi:MAG: hypothetical protein SVU32_04105, partial [Candidatus Nanohaloarchaea archaeon]|nr:hypothetical protein [Candidatus Nanohaloarchaea archaeon]